MGIASGIVAPGGTTTTDATAEQWHIKSGKTAYIASGKVTGGGYFPAMMQFDGSTGYYSKTSVLTSGNKITIVSRFSRGSFTGGGLQCLARMDGPTSKIRGRIEVASADYTTAAFQDRVFVQTENSAGASICLLLSPPGYLNGESHTIFYSFDGDTGSAIFRIDGVDVDDTGNASRVAPTTGTLESGASSVFSVGANRLGGNKYGGDVGFVGHRQAYLTNWQDFTQTDGSPKPLDESTWAEWGAQPLFWNPHGDMANNLGSAGAMTKNGTINVGNGGT